MDRRRFVVLVGGAAVGLAGCVEADDEPTEGAEEFEWTKTVDVPTVADPTVDWPTPRSDLRTHELVVEDDRVTVEGVLANDTGQRLDLVVVKAEVYDGAGGSLDTYEASTSFLEDGESWAYVVEVDEDPAVVADYDLRVLEIPELDDVEELEGDVAVREHEMVRTDGATTVQGVVENTSGGDLGSVTLRVVVYNDAGHRIGSFAAVVFDLEAGETGSFAVDVSDAREPVADYEIRRVGYFDESWETSSPTER